MDPSIIAALSGAPSFVVAVYMVVRLLQDQQGARKDFLTALQREREAAAQTMAAERQALEGVVNALGELRTAIERQSGVMFGAFLALLTKDQAQKAKDAAHELFPGNG